MEVRPIPVGSKIKAPPGKIGMLTPVGYHGTRMMPNGRTSVLWVFLCDCGREVVKRTCHVTSGNTISCGCAIKDRSVKHGHSRHQDKSGEYRAWCGMIQRCHNENNPKYFMYGERGIEVCQRWMCSFEKFLSDMGPRPSSKHSIDRINNNGHYCPENCRWATKTQQSRNRRNVLVLTANGQSKTISEWAESTGLKAQTIYMRVSDTSTPMRKRFLCRQEEFRVG